MATTEGLRPLRLGELLDTGLRLYARNWRVLCACVAGVVLPLQILSAIALVTLAPEQLDPDTADASLTATTNDPSLLAAECAILALQVLTYLLATGACFKAIMDARAGAKPTVRASLAAFGPRIAVILGVFVLFSIGVAAGAFAFLVPAVWLAVAWALAVPALMTEPLGVTQALRRSFRLVQGRWWGVFGTLLLASLLMLLVSGLVESLLVSPALGSEDAVVAAGIAFAGTVGGIVTAPFIAVVTTLLYCDQRVRKEGAELHAPEPEAPVATTRWLPPEPPQRT